RRGERMRSDSLSCWLSNPPGGACNTVTFLQGYLSARDKLSFGPAAQSQTRIMSVLWDFPDTSSKPTLMTASITYSTIAHRGDHRMTKSLTSFLVVLSLAGFFAVPFHAQVQAPPARTQTIAERTSSMQKLDGLFPLYWDERTGTLWLEISRF